MDVYHAFNMLSPWMVGRISDVARADHYYIYDFTWVGVQGLYISMYVDYDGAAGQPLAKGNYTCFIALSPNANDHLTSCRIQ